jgi:hypothetical protein
MRQTLTFEKIEAALDAGKVQMKRPWGDWVPVTRRGSTKKHAARLRLLHVWMENDVEAAISTNGAKLGFPDVRIAP